MRPLIQVSLGLVTSALLACGLAACTGPAEPGPDDPDGHSIPAADLRLLWIGNSLTYTNGLPQLVEVLAEAEGRTVAWRASASPNFSLEDHWHTGVEDLIRRGRADHVILQQGPSSLPANQEHLRTWSAQLAGPIRDAGGRPALYTVWPPVSRFHAFGDVTHAYRWAAEAAGGLLLPAGEAWLAAWDRSPDLALYGPDGFHPSPLGTLLAALTIYAGLTWDGTSEVPCPVNAVTGVEPEMAAILCEAVAQVTLAR